MTTVVLDVNVILQRRCVSLCVRGFLGSGCASTERIQPLLSDRMPIRLALASTDTCS